MCTCYCKTYGINNILDDVFPENIVYRIAEFYYPKGYINNTKEAYMLCGPAIEDKKSCTTALDIFYKMCLYSGWKFCPSRTSSENLLAHLWNNESEEFELLDEILDFKRWELMSVFMVEKRDTYGDLGIDYKTASLKFMGSVDYWDFEIKLITESYSESDYKNSPLNRALLLYGVNQEMIMYNF